MEAGWSLPGVKASVCFQGPYSRPTPRVSKNGEHAILCKSIKSRPTGRRCPSREGGRGRGGKRDHGLQGEHARLGCAQLRLASSSARGAGIQGGVTRRAAGYPGSACSTVWTVYLIKLSASGLGYIRLADLKTTTKRMNF